MTANSRFAVCLLALITGALSADAADWPTFGRDQTRNPVSREKNPPTDWDVTTGSNIRWSAETGINSFGTPVVADGLVWIGGHETRRRESAQGADAALLLCFRERDGKLLFTYKSPRLPGGRRHDPSWHGLSCSPLIDGDRLWFVTNRCETVCLDIGPLKRCEGKPRVIWRVDMRQELGTSPRAMIMGPGRLCSIGPSYKGLIHVITSNGVDETRTKIPSPEAPSVVCFDQEMGKIVWTDSSPGRNILDGQYASPLVLEINGRGQCIAPQGDGWIRSFDAVTGKLVWEFDMNLKESVFRHSGARNYFLAPPVYFEGRIYIASGQGMEEGEGPGRLVCLDPTRTGDISSELAVDAQGRFLPHRRLLPVDSRRGEKVIPNPNSGVIWEFRQCGDAFEQQMHRTVSTVAVHDGLVIAPDATGLVHCLDARTGERYWAYDTFSAIWSSPLIVDGHVYVGNEDGEMLIFRLSADPGTAMRKVSGELQPIARVQLDGSIYGSPIFANGTLYVPTRARLYTIAMQRPAAVAPAKPNVAAQGDWPQWRGPNRDNVSRETGLLQEWPEGGPPLLWQVAGIGEGIASVSISGGHVYTVGYREGQEFATALNAESGERLWASRIGPAVNESPSMRWFAQRSPTVDGDRVYTITAGGELICLSALDGREIWRRSYAEDFGAEQPRYGFYDCPLVDGEVLICTPFGSEGTVVALDQDTGVVRWRTIIPEARPAYAVPIIAEFGGIRQYIAHCEEGVFSVAAEDGRLLWRKNEDAGGLHLALTPLVQGDHLVCFHRRRGMEAFPVLMMVTGDRQVETLYTSSAHGLFRLQDNTVLVGDALYGTGPSVLMCLDWRTGEARWRVRKGRCALTCADGRLYLRTAEGTVLLAELNSERYVEKGSFRIPDHQMAGGATHPVVCRGRLYLRDNDRLLCYDIREGALQRARSQVKTITLPVPEAGHEETRPRSLRTGRDRAPDAIFVPTPHDVVDAMLKLANVQKSDVVCDLGSGDGRIVIAAAKHGCRAVGFEIDRELVKISRERVQHNAVADLVRIEHQDLFTADLSGADVVAVYLYPRLLARLKPRFAQMRDGSRIVSHQFAMPGIEPDRMITVESKETGEKHTLYVWTTPLREQPEVTP